MTAYKITFILPNRNNSGGVRVTCEMANCLIDAGHSVRIACRKQQLSTKFGLIKRARRIYRNFKGFETHDWLSFFRGQVVMFSNINDLDWAADEIAIAVGSDTVDILRGLKKELLKIRYCHGFQGHDQELMHSAWGGSMPTLSVSETLVDQLREYSGEDVMAVVPNGIKFEDYYIENDIERDGIGSIYGNHPNKGPESFMRVMQMLKADFADVPLRVFSANKMPSDLRVDDFQRYPPIPQARQFYNRSLIWLVASRNEGFCLPIVEAMACGCAVISTRHEAAPGLINDGENGLLVPIGDVDAFRDSIRKLLEDKDLRNKITENAQQTATQYTWSAAAEKMVGCLARL